MVSSVSGQSIAVDSLFLGTVWGQQLTLFGEIRGIDDKQRGKAVEQHFCGTLDEAIRKADEVSAKGLGTFFGILPRVNKGGKAENCLGRTHLLWADLDGKTFKGGMRGPQSAMAEIASMALAPHLVVDSGHGYHVYWLLDGWYSFEQAQRVMFGIEKIHHSDHCSDQPRVFRVPGTMNYKDEQPVPVRLVKFDLVSARYRLSDFADYASEGTAAASVAGGKGYSGGEDWRPSTPESPKFGPGERNNQLTRMAGIMVAKKMTPNDIMVALSWENAIRCHPPLMAHEVANIARSIERYRK